MPPSLPGRLASLARPPLLITLASLLALFYLVLFPGMIAASPALQQTGLLDTRISYTPAHAYQALEAYGPAGRAQYVRTTALLDFAFPVVYALLLGLVTARGLARAFPGTQRIPLASAAALCCADLRLAGERQHSRAAVQLPTATQRSGRGGGGLHAAQVDQLCIVGVNRRGSLLAARPHR